MRRLMMVVAVTGVMAGAVTPAAARAAGGSYVLTASARGSTYSPTFTGNGLLGVRVPAAGQGYAGGTVPAQSELAGFYAKPSAPKTVSDGVQQRASIPTWSTLALAVGGRTFDVTVGRMTGWRQSVDLHTGIVTTAALWRAPDGRVTQLRYQVLTDRADPGVGLVRLALTPRWSGAATVTDAIDGTASVLNTTDHTVLVNGAGKLFNAATAQDEVTVRAQTTGLRASIASRLVASAGAAGASAQIDQGSPSSIGQRLPVTLTSGHTYTFTKYVGVADSEQTPDPVGGAQAIAARAAAAGWSTLVAANDAAWARLWRGRIDVLGDRTLATDVNASEFYLWSSTRSGVDWSVSPAGLSSNGYDGHIFWDAETWMYPSLLAQHPDLAAGMSAYRFNRLRPAERHATATGHRGARFPWESAFDGTEQIPPPVSVNSEGRYEQHITADIAQAQWEYYLATGDRTWLADRGWPVISQAARFWASRVVRGAHGLYHLRHITGPDEENPDVSDEAFTMAGASRTVLDAVAAAHVLGHGVPSSWSQLAGRLAVLSNRAGAIQEFAGYRDQLVKQADVTLLPYVWRFPLSRRTQLADLNFYVPRTDPMGPSMSDAVNSIDTSALGTPGCASFVYVQRSYEPFIRDVFHQFSETSTGGAFTFMTGIGGFLQEFLYGFSGLRYESHGVRLAPSQTGQFGGEVLNDLAWHGRRFDVEVRPSRTRLVLRSGAPMTVYVPGGHMTARAGHAVIVRTARPDLSHSTDRIRCVAARASSSAPGMPALASVDGSVATPWEPASLPATLTVPVRGRGIVRQAVVVWGRQWPPAPAPNVKPPARPVLDRRATRYTLEISGDGRHWRRVFTVLGQSGTRETLRFAARRVRFARLVLTSAARQLMPLLEEFELTG